MKPFILTFVAILTTSTATLAFPTVTYAGQSFLERRADDDDRPTKTKSALMPRYSKTPLMPPPSKATGMPPRSKTPPPTRPKPKISSKPYNIQGNDQSDNAVDDSEASGGGYASKGISRQGPGRNKIIKNRYGRGASPKRDPSPPDNDEPVYAKINRKPKTPPKKQPKDENELVYADLDHITKGPPRRKSTEEEDLIYQNVDQLKKNLP
ncbi:hypothetical protein BASA83_001743 [Batrachochytrium salamandrivorans]|nr:hypothetical protein BASA62_004903 [Batrachochytrium salamandrivorans]KAH9275937.1 hypothetical protein BASA83_001743 [Batrachochytrium salamandrivorans]